MSATAKRVVVTGASSGIGEATARQLLAAGWSVLAVARRANRLERLAAEVGCDILVADVSVDADVERIVAAAGPQVTSVVNNAGGARGVDPIATAEVEQWQWMYEVNVLGTLRVTKALLPALIASGRGDVVVLTSIAGRLVYEGGAGYCAAKHAQAVIAETLRLELAGQPVRVIEICPGMVHTEEFSLRRLGGDQAAADRVYAGVANPLTADDVAESIVWTLTRPDHVNIDQLVIKPVAQAAPHKVIRSS